MIELDAQQRTLIADKLFDVANVAAGGTGNLGGTVCFQCRASRKDATMIGLYILLDGIRLFAGIVTVLDGISYRRRHRGSK